MYYEPVAVLYQANIPPSFGRTRKPIKPGGYRDSGADIAFGLRSRDIPVMTPVDSPCADAELDWVFPDTLDGIQAAYESGARVFWLNTVLHSGHPIETWFRGGLEFVGQSPEATQAADDKFETNLILRRAGLEVAESELVTKDSSIIDDFPRVLKPVRGRGSQGVHVVDSYEEYQAHLQLLLASQEFGSEFILEEILPGDEVTVTVMPPEGGRRGYWSLPPVRRFNHQNGVAPYNGAVAVASNSRALEGSERLSPLVQRVEAQCEAAAKMLRAKAPIRIDCRQDKNGCYKLFDLNMKPNMTGQGRPGREEQSSLSAIAARALGWSYSDLLLAMLATRWKL